MAGSVSLLVAWIFQRFPMIVGWGSAPDYTELMPHARAFLPLRGNQAVDPYRVYLDRLAAEDIRYDVYADHHVTRPFDDISLFSGCLTCSSTIIVPYLADCVMRKFGYTHGTGRGSGDQSAERLELR
ncbi:unnamed protein product [Lathyrus sativus]|nr:unnamed protein product [Lathyrus sativus]